MKRQTLKRKQYKGGFADAKSFLTAFVPGAAATDAVIKAQAQGNTGHTGGGGFSKSKSKSKSKRRSHMKSKRRY